MLARAEDVPLVLQAESRQEILARVYVALSGARGGAAHLVTQEGVGSCRWLTRATRSIATDSRAPLRWPGLKTVAGGLV